MIDEELADLEHGAIRPGGDLRAEFLLLDRNQRGSSKQLFDRLNASQLPQRIFELPHHSVIVEPYLASGGAKPRICSMRRDTSFSTS